MRALPCLLTVNAGSSSLKFAVFDVHAKRRIACGQIEGVGERPKVWVRAPFGDIDHELPKGYTMADAIASLVDWLETHHSKLRPVAVAHRVVHGGMQFQSATQLTPEVVAELELLDPVMPLHQPHNISGIRALTANLPGLPQFACFDTGFHQNWPPAARRFALPRAWYRAGIRRYGFHGLSYAYVSGQLARIDRRASRVVIAHLGSGASVCALKDGRSVDCTMGFSALDGLPMATRSGALDPGVVLHLIQHHKISVEGVERMLYLESGLLGVSQLSGDMRVLLASQAPRARESVELFAYRCVQAIGSMSATLGGIDALVFTGGIGQHAIEWVRGIAASTQYLGLKLAPAARPVRLGALALHQPRSKLRCYVIATDEELELARETVPALQRLAL